MRHLFVVAAALAAFSAHAEAPPTDVSAAHQQRANSLAEGYRQCLQDTLGERYVDAHGDPLKLAAEVEASCEPKLLPVNRYLGEQGYTDSVIRQALVEIKAKADGAAIAYVHRMPRYRF